MEPSNWIESNSDYCKKVTLFHLLWGFMKNYLEVFSDHLLIQ